MVAGTGLCHLVSESHALAPKQTQLALCIGSRLAPSSPALAESLLTLQVAFCLGTHINTEHQKSSQDWIKKENKKTAANTAAQAV